MSRRHRVKRREAFGRVEVRDFFGEERQRAKLEALGDPLVMFARVVPWETFRPTLGTLYDRERKGPAGRKPIDVVLMFKILILQRLYNLSDDQTEYQIRDRASFQRFLGLHVEHGSPDAKTIWLFRERLKEKHLLLDLFGQFDAHLTERGLTARGGQIVDATIVEAPRQRNTREENATIKNDGIPEGWEAEPNKLAQKDLDARWTKKHDQTHYGYKNHLNVDVEHKIIRSFQVTDAAIHDSQVFDDLLTSDQPVYADSAYRSQRCEAELVQRGIESRIHERAYANAPLSDEQKARNKEKSRVRARVEHIFGFGHTSMNQAGHIRCIGSLRAMATIGLSNLAYNMSRLIYLSRKTLPPRCRA